MLRTLVVEDEAGKREAIARALTDVEGFSVDNIETVTDAFGARRVLRGSKVDLLILDIVIPERADQSAAADTGIRLLLELMRHPEKYQVPAHIIGITAYPEVFADSIGHFSSRLLSLLHYDPASSDWEKGLQARVEHLIRATTAESGDETYSCHLAVLCALWDPELTSILALPWGWRTFPARSDHSIYWRGDIRNPDAPKVAYAASTARMGVPAAAIAAMKMIDKFRPQYMAMTGIAAGIKGEVNLGDVIVADPTWDWGSGKWTVEGNDQRFQPSPHHLPLDVAVRSNCLRIAQDDALLDEIWREWPRDKPSTPPRIHVGPLASGTSVLADGTTPDRIRGQHRNLLGVEMEAYGVFAASEEAARPRPTPIVIKSVVDFADTAKSDQFRQYCAYVSASVLRRFVERYT